VWSLHRQSVDTVTLLEHVQPILAPLRVRALAIGKEKVLAEAGERNQAFVDCVYRGEWKVIRVRGDRVVPLLAPAPETVSDLSVFAEEHLCLRLRWETTIPDTRKPTWRQFSLYIRFPCFGQPYNKESYDVCC